MEADSAYRLDVDALARFNDRMSVSIEPLMTHIERFRVLDTKLRVDSFANILRVLRIIQAAFVFKPELAEDCRRAMEELEFWLIAAEQASETSASISADLLLCTEAITQLYEDIVGAGPAIETERTRGAAQLREGVYER